MSDNLTPDSIGKILRSLRGQVTVHWKALGRFLDVPTAKLDLIDEDSKTSPEKLDKMLVFWLNNGHQRTWTTLIRAVASEVGGQNRVLAKRIKEERLDACGVFTEKR